MVLSKSDHKNAERRHGASELRCHSSRRGGLIWDLHVKGQGFGVQSSSVMGRFSKWHTYNAVHTPMLNKYHLVNTASPILRWHHDMGSKIWCDHSFIYSLAIPCNFQRLSLRKTAKFSNNEFTWQNPLVGIVVTMTLFQITLVSGWTELCTTLSGLMHLKTHIGTFGTDC